VWSGGWGGWQGHCAPVVEEGSGQGRGQERRDKGFSIEVACRAAW
jgi:hypothetical protein